MEGHESRDAHIARESHVVWWFSGSSKDQHARWFQPNPVTRAELDEFITVHFSENLKEAETFDVDLIDFGYPPSSVLYGHLLALDQFSRHIYRGQTERIDTNTEKAVEFAVALLNIDELYCNALTPSEQAFLLMPLKHHNTLKYYDAMMLFLNRWKYTEHPVLTRFWKDLLKRYSKLMNQRVTLCVPYNKTTDKFAEITEYCPPSFYTLRDHDFTHMQSTTYRNNIIINEMRKRLMDLDLVKGSIITVSVSGGVDSMVDVWVLKILEPEFGYKLQAVHLNYKNRKVSDIETDFVHYYCSCLDVPLYIRTITEIHRKTGEAQRDFYESHTRDIRFGMYKHVGGIIVLGHIHDDIIENIWTNFARGRDLFNLPKMEILCEQNGVHLWRPLLNIEKSVILDFSKQFGIAYLLNTTPAWSNRGKFRTSFLPAVHQQYGVESDKNVELMARSLQEYHTFLQHSLFQPFLNSVIENRFGIHFELTATMRTLGLHFWQTVLADIFHKRGLSLPSRTSLEIMISVITSAIIDNDRFKKQNYIMLTLKAELFVRIIKKANKIWMFILEKKLILASGMIHCESENQLGTGYWKAIKKALDLDELLE